MRTELRLAIVNCAVPADVSRDPLGFETRSLPALTRSYRCRFAFYVARPTRSIHQNRVAGFPRSMRKVRTTSRRKVFSRKPLTFETRTTRWLRRETKCSFALPLT